VLTPRGEALVKGPPAHWIASSIEGEPKMSCSDGGSVVSYRITGVAAVQPSQEGADLLKGRTFQREPFQADMVYGPAGWRLEELRTEGGPDPSVAALTGIFGDPEAVGKARYRFALEMNRRVR